MAALPFLIGIPVAIEQAVENESLNLGLLAFFKLFRVAREFGNWFAIAPRIDIRRKENVLPIGRPEFAVRFRRNQSEPMRFRHSTRRAIEVRHPNLRRPSL